MSTLYLVATPIGNLEDITQRAMRILKEVPRIAAEDTRQTRKLLSHYKIDTIKPLISFHEHSDSAQLAKLIAALDEGDLALVSDAGTPGINDPGFALVRAALDAGHRISPIPGPSAPVAALTASGLPSEAFLYLGYLPRKSAQRQAVLDEVASQPYSLIFLETPHRLVSALEDIRAVLGERQICVAREMTKLYEEFIRGTTGEVLQHFQAQTPRGEITLIIAGASTESETWAENKLRDEIVLALNEDEKPSKIARRLTAISGWARREIYNLITEIQE
jgi:16S rRNA (cytidine1402-2'-O)-methyltransferase